MVVSLSVLVALSLVPAPCRYFASCVGGVEPILAAELASPRIGARDVAEGRLGVSFTGSAEVGARAVLWSRTALRIMELLTIAEGVYDADALYEATRDAADWSELLAGPEQTISVQAVLGTQRAAEAGRMRQGDWQCGACGATVFASKSECFRCRAPKPQGEGMEQGLTHTHFSALTVKNAVCDALRERHGWRPSVDAEDADLPLFLHVHKGEASLYRMLSGVTSLHKRGYRTGQAVHAAALRETLAAAMLLHAGYEPSTDVLCDPMCGSGTIPIEAALIATDSAPGLLRPPPALSRWPDSDPSLWRRLTAEARAAVQPRAPCAILANDVYGGALTLAERAARAAGVASSIEFSEGDALAYRPSGAPRLVVTNPPWDIRLDGGEEAWRSLSMFLKRECGGARAWVLSGSKDLTQHLRMRAASRLRIENAGTSLALIAYDVLAPREPGAAIERPSVAPAPTGDAVERRIDHSDGVAYTKAEWLDFLGVREGEAAWAAAAPAHLDLARSDRGQHDRPTPVAAAPFAATSGEAELEELEEADEEEADEVDDGEIEGSAPQPKAMASLEKLSRKELQAASKEHGIRANQKSEVLIAELAALQEQLVERDALRQEAGQQREVHAVEVPAAAAPASPPKPPPKPARVAPSDSRPRPSIIDQSVEEEPVTLADATGKDGADLENVFANLYG